MLNVAVWGLGTHAFKNVLPAVVASGAAKLVGVCSREEASRRRASREFGCAAWPDATAMLADDRVNTVYLATPVGLHFEQGLNVLRSGRHLICEKSLTDSHVKSIGLVAEARQHRLVLGEAFMYRFHPRLQSIFELVRREEFGAIVTVTSNFFLPSLERPGYRYTASLGGGAFLDAGCYPISFLLGLGVGSLARRCCGGAIEDRPPWVGATGRRTGTKQRSSGKRSHSSSIRSLRKAVPGALRSCSAIPTARKSGGATNPRTDLWKCSLTPKKHFLTSK